MAAIKFGDLIKVYFSVESPLWRANAIEIAIPIRRGILNYRVILIHKDNAEKFSKITTLEQLKAMKLGVQNDWETGEILAQYGFEMEMGNNYDGLFSMLAQQRFD